MAYVAAGWAVAAGVLALYSWGLVRRGRRLRRSLPLPAGDRPWR